MQVINLMAASLDGRIASHADESDAERKRLGFTNEADHVHMLRWLRQCDAVIVGAHSVNVSGGVMEVLNKKGVHPTWVMLSNRGYAPDQSIWNHPNTPKWLVSCAALPADRCVAEAKQIVYSEGQLVEDTLKACKSAGFQKVLLFGGGQVNRAFYAASGVDELVLTVCPVLVGKSTGVPLVAPELPDSVQFKLQRVEEEGDLVFLHYLVQR
ncbi:MAG: dihydrofolate reductase family protein [Bacteroidetes bacterium]|nr:dihydrofolate reductase family protein [Bacteroidota bacterium]